MKTFIQNRHGQKLAVVVEQPKQPTGLAFVMHGLGGFKEQPFIRTAAGTLLDYGYTVVTFDTTNTFGESDGDYADATTTNYYEDLEDVIAWAMKQSWYIEPFILAGHSLGGICTALYAEQYPTKVKAPFPASTVVSGKLSLQSEDPKALAEWKQTGWQEEPSRSKPGVMKRLKWSHMEDRQKYNLLPNIGKLTMPVLLVVGQHDESTPVQHQQLLYEALPGSKEIHIIKGAPHTFRDPKHLQEIHQIVNNWLKKVA
ncbi:MAG: alpha/beta fold hydrolase [Candidatus Kerfeldbacteria bacterium]|nr:alpha/beta fold hydrolase [Candidatus Kerfeldbacteria bacterium]